MAATETRHTPPTMPATTPGWFAAQLPLLLLPLLVSGDVSTLGPPLIGTEDGVGVVPAELLGLTATPWDGGGKWAPIGMMGPGRLAARTSC